MLNESGGSDDRSFVEQRVGALCLQSGYNIIQDWINQLLEPSEKRTKNDPPTLNIPSPLPQQIGAPADIGKASLARIYGQLPDTPTFSQPSPHVIQPPLTFLGKPILSRMLVDPFDMDVGPTI